MLVKIEVMVPFSFCENCPNLEVGTLKEYDWETGNAVKAEYNCVYAYGCLHASADTYKQTKEMLERK